MSSIQWLLWRLHTPWIWQPSQPKCRLFVSAPLQSTYSLTAGEVPFWIFRSRKVPFHVNENEINSLKLKNKKKWNKQKKVWRLYIKLHSCSSLIYDTMSGPVTLYISHCTSHSLQHHRSRSEPATLCQGHSTRNPACASLCSNTVLQHCICKTVHVALYMQRCNYDSTILSSPCSRFSYNLSEQRRRGCFIRWWIVQVTLNLQHYTCNTVRIALYY